MDELHEMRARMHATIEGESLRLIGTTVARALARCTDGELGDREAVGQRVLEELRLRGFTLIETTLPPTSALFPDGRVTEPTAA